MNPKKDPPIISFKTPEDWERWLVRNHEKTEGIWLRFFKKDSGIPTITYAQALDEALCYGWIDGQAKRSDEKSYLQKFTPRRRRSTWSKRNIEHIERLIKLDKLKPSGMREVETAKADGRWKNAYASPKNMLVPDEFLKELAKNKKANEFFKSLNKSDTYAIAWQIHNAKRPETRQRRIKKFADMLKRGEKLH